MGNNFYIAEGGYPSPKEVIHKLPDLGKYIYIFYAAHAACGILINLIRDQFWPLANASPNHWTMNNFRKLIF